MKNQDAKSQKNMRKKIIQQLNSEEGNNICFDCDRTPAQWASVNNAIFLCLDCSGEHRAFGYNVSFIKSATLDNWYIKYFIKIKERSSAKSGEIWRKCSLKKLFIILQYLQVQ